VVETTIRSIILVLVGVDFGYFTNLSRNYSASAYIAGDVVLLGSRLDAYSSYIRLCIWVESSASLTPSVLVLGQVSGLVLVLMLRL
jgi:hypothetical protein